MPNVHSKTLFHFTNQEGLLGILRTNFHTSFSRERITSGNGRHWDYWAPMICFCDIPLHLIANHINEYGQYGLGLSREWAIKSKLNPVFYYQENSLLFDELDSMMTLQHEDITGLNKTGIAIKSTRDIYLKSRYILQYYKPWYGYDFKIKKEKCFYDEREWRYVPIQKDQHESLYNDDEEFKNKKDEHYAKLLNPILKFEPRDITYIVLENENKRYDLINIIKDVKDKYSFRDVETLVSKIITVEQIKNDI